MKKILFILCSAVVLHGWAQPKIVRESVAVSGQDRLDLEFTFADEITFQTWDKQEVLVEVSVEINDGEDNDIFSLISEKGHKNTKFTNGDLSHSCCNHGFQTAEGGY